MDEKKADTILDEIAEEYMATIGFTNDADSRKFLRQGILHESLTTILGTYASIDTPQYELEKPWKKSEFGKARIVLCNGNILEKWIWIKYAKKCENLPIDYDTFVIDEHESKQLQDVSVQDVLSCWKKYHPMHLV